MLRLLVAGFVSTVLGAFEFAKNLVAYEPEMLFVFIPVNGLIALTLVAVGWLMGSVIPQVGRYRFWILLIAWLAWVAAYNAVASGSIALAALIVFAIAAPDRDPTTIPEPPVC